MVASSSFSKDSYWESEFAANIKCNYENSDFEEDGDVDSDTDYYNGTLANSSTNRVTDEDEADCGCSSGYAGYHATAAAISTTNPPSKTDMRYEANRLDSFASWPQNANADPQLLARDGFIYSGTGDTVTCIFCSGSLRDWKKSDYPDEEHANHYPHCRFVLGEDVGNVAIATDPRRTINRSSTNNSFSNTLAPSVKSPRSTPDLSSKSSNSVNKAIVSSTLKQFPLDEREVKARMDTKQVRTVVGMGYPESLVQDVLRHRLQTVGDDFLSLSNFVEALDTTKNKTNDKRQQLPTSSENTQRTQKSEHRREKVEKISTGSQTVASATEQLMKSTVESKKESTATIKLENVDQNIRVSNNVVTVKPPSSTHAGDKCNKCLVADINSAFLPCGHALLCTSCAQSLTTCTLCGVKITELFRIYLS